MKSLARPIPANRGKKILFCTNDFVDVYNMEKLADLPGEYKSYISTDIGVVHEKSGGPVKVLKQILND